MSDVNLKLPFAAIFAMACPCDVTAKSISWGLPGSSRTAFESGSHRCAIDVAQRDVSADKPTRKFVRGFEVLERENNMPPMDGQGLEDDVTRARRQVLLRNAYGTDKHIDSLQNDLQNELGNCLTRAGYIEFALTEAQEKRLSKLKRGSESRERYLYELGSDEKIVLAQRTHE